MKFLTCQFPLLEVCCAQGLSVWTVCSSGPASFTCPLSGLFLVISTLVLFWAIPESTGNQSNPPNIQTLGSGHSLWLPIACRVEPVSLAIARNPAPPVLSPALFTSRNDRWTNAGPLQLQNFPFPTPYLSHSPWQGAPVPSSSACWLLLNLLDSL